MGDVKPRRFWIVVLSTATLLLFSQERMRRKGVLSSYTSSQRVDVLVASSTRMLRKVEPGVYLQEFGVRSEVNMLVRSGKAESNW